MLKVAVIIPCLNEQAAIARVVADCRMHLPFADIYVLDNGSEDETARIAIEAGASVIHSPLRGKGNVVRHAFRAVEADFFILIDGDGTYPLSEAQRLLKIAKDHNYDMVMGSRLENGNSEAFRPLHYLGNRFFTSLVRLLFSFPVKDLLTGYRVFSRQFAKEINLISGGFEVETELTIRAMAQRFAFCEVSIPYGQRAIGGESKLRTFRDGTRILMTILRFVMYFRPLLFFSILAASLGAVAWLGKGEMRMIAGLVSGLFFVLGFYLDWRLNLERLGVFANGRRNEASSDEHQSKVA